VCVCVHWYLSMIVVGEEKGGAVLVVGHEDSVISLWQYLMQRGICVLCLQRQASLYSLCCGHGDSVLLPNQQKHYGTAEVMQFTGLETLHIAQQTGMPVYSISHTGAQCLLCQTRPGSGILVILSWNLPNCTSMKLRNAIVQFGRFQVSDTHLVSIE
jgi:hypothetical protein